MMTAVNQYLGNLRRAAKHVSPSETAGRSLFEPHVPPPKNWTDQHSSRWTDALLGARLPADVADQYIDWMERTGHRPKELVVFQERKGAQHNPATQRLVAWAERNEMSVRWVSKESVM